MACLLAPLTEAILISTGKAIAKKTIKDSEKKAKFEGICKKVNVLQNMLYGGSFLLAVEHIYHGEITFFPPFLTAMNNPADTAEMLHEIATSGVAMAILVTTVWGMGICLSKIFKGKKFFSKKGVIA